MLSALCSSRKYPSPHHHHHHQRREIISPHTCNMTCQFPKQLIPQLWVHFTVGKRSQWIQRDQLELPTIRRFRDLMPLARKYLVVKCHSLYHTTLGSDYHKKRKDGDHHMRLLPGQNLMIAQKTRWRKGENMTSNSIHETQRSVEIDRNAACG